MKRNILAIVAVLFFVGSAFAQDPIDIGIDIDNENNITATGGNATAEQDQQQEQNQHMNFYERTQLPHLQYGTNFVTPGVTIGGMKWEMYCPLDKRTLRRDQVERARTRNGLWASIFGNSDDLVVTMVNERMTGNPETISCLNYWPENGMAAGVEVVADVTGYGRNRQNLVSLQADVANACMVEAGTPYYAMMLGTDVDGVTEGNSISIGGATSGVFHNGSRGVVVTGGGQIGTIKTSQQEKYKIWAKCITNGRVYTPPPAVVIPPPPKVCNPNSILIQIERWREACKHCGKPCFNNERLRKGMGDAYLDLYHCTGKKEYLYEAIKQYKIAQRDYLNGREPDGMKTTKLKGAQATMHDAYYNWSWAVRETQGRDAQIRFAKKHGLKKMPTCYEDLKR